MDATRRGSHRLMVLGIGLLSLTLLWACDDENLFEARAVDRPEVLALSAPAQVRAGQVLDVRVRAAAELALDSIVVTARGAFSAKETVLVGSNLRDATVDVTFDVPVTIADTVVVITATAVDAAGNVSEQVSDTVRVLDSTAPSVTVGLSREVVGLGSEVAVIVEAEDNVGLQSLGFRLIQEFRDSLTSEVIEADTLITELVAVTGSKRDSTFRVTIPEDTPEGDIIVEAFATDLDGNETVVRAGSPLQVVFIDVEPPVVSFATPRDGDTQPVGDSLFVEVNLTDNGGVDSVEVVGVSFRGDPDLGTDTTVLRFAAKGASFASLPGDTTFTRILEATADSASEDVHIIATAFDAQGNVGADTVTMIIGGPKVDLLLPEDDISIPPGAISIRARARDPQQLTSVQVEVTGVIDTLFTVPLNPSVDSITVDTVLVVPEGVTGELTFVARARNTLDVPGASAPTVVTIVEGGVEDDVQPQGLISASAPDRLEVEDNLTVEVSAQDDAQGTGIVRMGFTALAISPTRGDTLAITDEVTFADARRGLVSRPFEFTPFNVDELALPDTLNFDITGWAFDGAGNCAAFLSTGSLTTRDCEVRTIGGEEVVVAVDASGLRVTRAVVAGRTVFLPGGGFIADAVVDSRATFDPNRTLLYLSNIERDRVEVFDLVDESFQDAVLVGSEPWGMAFSRTDPDTLLVANSGGTNISRVFIGDGSAPFEDPNGRIATPNDFLTEVKLEVGEGSRQFTFTFFDFSDRPQFVAQDSVGRVVYSTKPTPAAGQGTIRMAVGEDPDTHDPYDQLEVSIFFEYALPDAVGEQEDSWVFARVDRVDVGVDPDLQILGLFICDHPPGFPDQQQCTEPEGAAPEVLAERMRALVPESDAFVAGGAWNIPALALTDTTFVSASGDGGWVAFGEGASNPTGRIILWNAAEPSVSQGIPVRDLVNNASDFVTGVALNQDGTLGAARGDQAYFFTNDLRLQGSPFLVGGGAGIALHPLHSDAKQGNSLRYDPNTHLAFMGTGQGSVDIRDTFHFFRTGRIFIRDVVSGPLKVSLPFPEDNADLPAGSCADRTADGAIRLFDDALGQVINQSNSPECVVLKLYGVTDAGGVVVVDVTKNDILREHPANEN